MSLRQGRDVNKLHIERVALQTHRWPGQNPIGKRLHAGNPHKGYPWATIVGVVANTSMGTCDEEAMDQWYIPPVSLPSFGAPTLPLTLPAPPPGISPCAQRFLPNR